MSTAPPIANIIVVMLENRSYDNMLGWLYHARNLPPYDQAPAGQTGLSGLTGAETNPNPAGGRPIPISNQTGTNVNGESYPATVIPGYDPGELFSDMAQQIFGLSAIPAVDPYNASPAHAETMQGFTTNYSQLGNVPSANIADVMNYFTPAQVPVTAFLANKFAVCDQWFASVPCQTFTNRVFAVCAAPAVQAAGKTVPAFSFVNDKQYENSNPAFGGLEDLASIFSALDAAFPNSSLPNWKVYFHDYTIAMMTVPYVYQAGRSDKNVNVATFDYSDWPQGTTPEPFIDFLGLGAAPPTFLQDLAAGNLPKLSFIEPRYSSNVATIPNPPNSNHPGPFTGPADVAQGEAFLAQLYNALQASETYWTKNKTLLIVTYDEHGGTYDHVPPPAATPPGGSIPAAQDPSTPDPAANGFNFNRYGCRVPAIIVSPCIEPGSAVQVAAGSTPFDHSSIVKTVAENFGLAPLTGRDAAAPSLLGYLKSTPVNATGQYTGPVPQSAPRPAQTSAPVNGATLLHARFNQSVRR